MTTAGEPVRALSASLVRPGDSGWEDARRSFNGTIDHHPTCILSCGSTEDVVSAVRYARALDHPIAVRGGGHSVAGHGIAHGAVVVSLDRMRAVEVDPDRRIARVGGGALWLDVDPATQAHGLAVPGGTFGDTGVGGLTLGGGLGWLLGIAGLTCDNLVAAELVTADGTVVQAGPDGDPDLLWALRGGGGNFGVVTRFEYALTPVGPLLGGHVSYPISAAPRVLERVEAIIEGGPAAFAPFLGVQLDPDTRQPLLSIGFGMAGDLDEAERAVAPLRRDLPIVLDDVGRRSYIDVQAMSGELPFGLRHYWKGYFTTGIDAALVERLSEAVVRQPIHDGFVLIEAIVGAARREPAGGAAFGQRAARWNATTLAIWESADEDDAALAWARETADLIQPFSLSGAGYANYASADETDERVRAAFGPERFARLAATKRRYDPDNVFRYNLNVPPAAGQLSEGGSQPL